MSQNHGGDSILPASAAACLHPSDLGSLAIMLLNPGHWRAIFKFQRLRILGCAYAAARRAQARFCPMPRRDGAGKVEGQGFGGRSNVRSQSLGTQAIGALAQPASTILRRTSKRLLQRLARGMLSASAELNRALGVA